MVVATVDYMAGRKKYGRPQALLLANNPGTVETIDEKPYYIPLGQEVDSAGFAFGGNEFIILSDDNRQALDLKTTRIEKRERTVNGRMQTSFPYRRLGKCYPQDLLTLTQPLMTMGKPLWSHIATHQMVVLAG
jgi:hypothetical protein